MKVSPPLLTAEEIPELSDVEHIVWTHCHELSSADGIVIVHPNWWGTATRHAKRLGR